MHEISQDYWCALIVSTLGKMLVLPLASRAGSKFVLKPEARGARAWSVHAYLPSAAWHGANPPLHRVEDRGHRTASAYQ